MATVKISISTKSELLEQLEAHVIAKERTRNWLFNKAVEEYIINHQKEV